MGKMSIDMPRDLMDALSRLADNTDEICMQALEDAKGIAESELKAECSKHHISKRDPTRGQMAASIRATKPKKNSYGIYSFVRPTGTDTKGVRNMEKLTYLEYGREGQPGTPVCHPAANRIEPKVAKIIQKTIERKTGL